MALITTGSKFLRALEQEGALAVYAPLEGGYEGRYLRRLRSKGYSALTYSARGLGDPAQFLMDIHGVRPPHLGKQTIGNEAAVGRVEYVLPLVGYPLQNLPANAKGLVLWLLEGHVLSPQELSYFVALPQAEPRLKVVIEMGGDRSFSWQPLAAVAEAA